MLVDALVEFNLQHKVKHFLKHYYFPNGVNITAFNTEMDNGCAPSGRSHNIVYLMWYLVLQEVSVGQAHI